MPHHLKRPAFLLFLLAACLGCKTAIAQPRGDYDRYYYGIDLLQEKAFLPALAYLDSSAVHPTDMYDLYNYRGVCYQNLGQYESALECYRYILARTGQYPEAEVNFAHTLYEAGHVAQAIKTANALISQKTMEEHARNLLGNIAFDQQKYREAIGWYSSAAQTNNALWTPWYNLGNTYFQLQRYDSAIYFHQQARTLNNTDLNNLMGLAMAYSGAGRAPEAITVYREIIARDSSSYRAYAGIGYALMSMPGYDADDIAFYLQRAISMEPARTWDVYNRMGDLYESQGMRATAFDYYTKAIDLNPNNMKAYAARGDIYRDSGLYGNAIQQYMMAQYVDPNSSYPNLALGGVMSRLHDAGTSEMYFDRYVQLADDRLLAYRRVNNVRAYNGLLDRDYDATLRYSSLSLANEPDDAEALSYMGMAMAKKGKADSALLYLNRSAALDPYNAGVYHHRAYAYALKGNNEEACTDLKRLYAMNRSFAIDSLLAGVNMQTCKLGFGERREPPTVKMEQVLGEVQKSKTELDEKRKNMLLKNEEINPPAIADVYRTDMDIIERVYPNPATEDFMIYLKGRITKPVLVNIPASNGFTGRQYTLTDQRQSVSVSCHDWAPGTYTIMLITGNREIGRTKIVVNR